MPVVDRLNAIHAKRVFEKLLPEESVRESMIEFISTAIEFAHSLNNGNWNLNLDKNGQFVRFNTGQEYCIEVTSKESLILCNRQSIRDIARNKRLEIAYRGHKNRERIQSENLDSVPDCLAKVPNSIGCVIKNEIVIEYFDLLEEPNHEFINDAIQGTYLLKQSKSAHSVGCIKYFSEVTGREIPNPFYSIQEKDFFKKQLKNYLSAKKLSIEELENRIKKAKPNAELIYIISAKYNRNPFLAEYVKRLANGICQCCKKPAPFYSKKLSEPFLESHHIIPLSEGGQDSIENLIALCPNCHREKHYG